MARSKMPRAEFYELIGSWRIPPRHSPRCFGRLRKAHGNLSRCRELVDFR